MTTRCSSSRRPPGEWHLAELHQSATGRGVRVAVIDSGDPGRPSGPAQQVADRLNLVADRADSAELHGTAVAGHHRRARRQPPRHRRRRAPRPHPGAARLLAGVRGRNPVHQPEPGAGPERGHRARRGHHQPEPGRPARPADPAPGRVGTGARTSWWSRRPIALVPDGGFPAALPGVIAVSDARRSQGTRAVAAPGTDILTTLPGSRWGLVSGASYAAAHVSGLLALMLDARSRNPSFAGKPRAMTVADLVAGADGRIDACASLAQFVAVVRLQLRPGGRGRIRSRAADDVRVCQRSSGLPQGVVRHRCAVAAVRGAGPVERQRHRRFGLPVSRRFAERLEAERSPRCQFRRPLRLVCRRVGDAGAGVGQRSLRPVARLRRLRAGPTAPAAASTSARRLFAFVGNRQYDFARGLCRPAFRALEAAPELLARLLRSPCADRVSRRQRPPGAERRASACSGTPGCSRRCTAASRATARQSVACRPVASVGRWAMWTCGGVVDCERRWTVPGRAPSAPQRLAVQRLVFLLSS